MKIKKQACGLMFAMLALGSLTPAHAADAITTEIHGESSSCLVTIPKTITLGADKRARYSIKVEGDIAANQQVCVVPVDGIADTEAFDFYMEYQMTDRVKANAVAQVNQNKLYWTCEEVAAGYEETENYVVASGISSGIWKGIFQMKINIRTAVENPHPHDYVDGVCSICGAACEHAYATNISSLPWNQTGNGTYKFVQDGTKWTSNNKGVQSSTATSTWTINVPEATENIIRYKVSSESGYDKFTLKLDGATIANAISGAGSELAHTATLSAGTHTLTATYSKDGSTDKNDDCAYVILEGFPFNNHKCGNCGHEQDHSYAPTVTQEPTCVETGIRTYACVCGDSYTETIPATGHDYVDGACAACGHEHAYVPNAYKQWDNASNGTYAFIQDGTKWTSNNKGVNSSTATSTWTFNASKNTEYAIKYKVSSEANYDKFTLKLDDVTIANAISGAGSELTHTATLSAGTHTLTATYSKDGSTSSNNDCAYVILEKIDQSNHICSDCGYEQDHDYAETVTQEPTCTETGIKTYACASCGDGYTESVPATGHSYASSVIQEPTCAETGIKTYACACGDGYTESMPITRHNYVDGICIICGNTGTHLVAPASAYGNWNYTLDDVNDIITLNYYTGNETNVIVYGNYPIGEKTYKTRIASDAKYSTTYMFNGNAQPNCKNIKTITFSSDIDTSNVTDMSHMFYQCTSLTSLDLTSFNTSNVTTMNGMFFNCTSLTSLDLTNFNTSNVTDMHWMFYSCSSLTSLDLTSFNTSNVTNMNSMFQYCSSLTSLDLTNFNTGNVTDMNWMFYYCTSLTRLDISCFNTRNVTIMGWMFAKCTSLTSLDLTNFNTSNVTDMEYMFAGCTKLKAIYATSGKWTTAKASTTNMFSNCGTSSVTYR